MLVHAAGVLRDRMLHKASDADWSEVLAVHLNVAVELTRVMAGPIRTGRWGRIVYVGGAAGLVGSVGQASYDVAKAGCSGSPGPWPWRWRDTTCASTSWRRSPSPA